MPMWLKSALRMFKRRYEYALFKACTHMLTHIHVSIYRPLPFLQSNLDHTLLLDQLVNYSCSANWLGQYCASAQLESLNTDVCIHNYILHAGTACRIIYNLSFLHYYTQLKLMIIIDIIIVCGVYKFNPLYGYMHVYYFIIICLMQFLIVVACTTNQTNTIPGVRDVHCSSTCQVRCSVHACYA